MAKLTLPDGRVIKFPDGLQPDQVQSIVQAASAPQAAAPPPAPVADATPQLPPEQPPQRSLARDAGLTARAVGRGAGADLLGQGGDMAAGINWWNDNILKSQVEGINNLAIPALEKAASWATGGPAPDIPDIPAPPEGLGATFLKLVSPNQGFANALLSGPTSDRVANAAEDVGQKVGIDLPVPETPGERLANTIMRFTSGALVGGKGARMADSGALQGGKRAVAGDLGAGVGAGAATGAMDEYAPDWVKDSPIARLIAPLLGAVAGSSLARPLDTAAAIKERTMPASPELTDPATLKTPRQKTANEAARFLQSNVSDKTDALAKIEEAIQFNKDAGGAMPTVGMASDDVGLRMQEKGAALRDPATFAKRYEDVAKDASNDVKALQNPGADQNLPKQIAEQAIADKLSAAEGNVNAMQGQLDRSTMQAGNDLTAATGAERGLGDVYRAYAGGGADASTALDNLIVDQTMRPMQAEKNARFQNIDPEGSTFVPAEELLAAVKQIEENAKNLPPSMKGQVVPSNIVGDLKNMTSNPEDLGVPMLPFKTLTEMRPVLSSMESQARQASQFPLADSIRSLKKATGNAGETLAATGGEAGQRAQDALDYYKNEFAPAFGQGEGAKLRKAVNTDDLARTKTPPSKTASRFLNGGPEAAADLQRIIEKAPDPATAQAEARKYVLDSLSSTIGADGKVSEVGLQKWINNRKGMLDQMPELKAEVDGLLADVRRTGSETKAVKAGGETAVNRMRNELEGAKKGLARTKEEINQSALKLYMGNNPENAVAAMLSNGDPVAAIKEVKAALGNDTAAMDGLKATFADHLVNKVTTADGDNISYAKLAQAFKKNEAAMAEVFGGDMKYLRQAQKRLEMLSRKNVQAAAGSPTVENTGLVGKIKKPFEIVMRMMYGALEGGSKMRKFNLMAEQLPDASKAANDLVKRAILDPRVAKHLLATPLKEVGTPLWNRKLFLLLGINESNRAAAAQD